MYTSILLVAVVGPQAPAANRAPDWKLDYAVASREGRSSRKPLAVFVGRGADGWGQVSDTGRLGPDVRSLLGENYVCLYVDRDTPAGRRLASDLELTSDGPGLVISDATGELQAFRHSGTMAPEDLSRHLRTFSDPNRVVVRTEGPIREDVRFYAPPPPPPVYGGGFYPGFGFGRGGCSSCH